VRVLRAADRIATPWRNGGGVTREVAAFPPGAGMDAFAWRVSLADVAADGPFSAFPGVDRLLTVIEGSGLVLDLDGRLLALGVNSPPIAFAGETPVEARLIQGPIRDLNVMLRRGVWRAEVSWSVSGALIAPPDGPLLALVLADATCSSASAVHQLSALDMVMLEAGETATFDLAAEARALNVRLHATTPKID
jgi:environmental stress-induced protein Ves